jgi:sec-independent protein translocase protein TatA
MEVSTMPGVQELIIILLIVVVLFGASRLPQLGRGMGEAITNFKRGLKADEPTATDSSKDNTQNT